MSSNNREFYSVYKQFFSSIFARLLKIFFHLLYHPFAFIYDLIANIVSFGKWYQWVDLSNDFLTGTKILELGHGTGHLQVTLQKRKFINIALDESSQMGKLTRKRIRAINKYPKLIRCQAEQLPLKNSYFDNIISTFPTIYIFHPNTLSEAYRILLPGGRFVVLLAAKITGTNLFERILAWIYIITSQVPPPEQDLSIMSSPFSDAGFKTSINWIPGYKYSLLFLLADKPVYHN